MNYCTLFDSKYLSRGLTMFNSLMQHSPSSHLYVVCLDDQLFVFLTNNLYSNLTPISLKHIEAYYPELTPAKHNRTYVEYIFTLSPAIALYILEKFPQIDQITTLDADVYFFSDPSPIIKSYEPFSIGITPHNYKKSLMSHLHYGKYNVSFQTFKNNEIGLKCLKKWKQDCIEWCYDRLEGNKFADQKYLDDWTTLYPEVVEYQNGLGIAPWNILNKDIALNEDGKIYINKNQLVYYHFHGLRNITKNIYSLDLAHYLILSRKKIIKHIYLNYIDTLDKINAQQNRNKIARTTHPHMGKLFYLIFLADLYSFKHGRLTHIYNLNFLRMFYNYLKSI